MNQDDKKSGVTRRGLLTGAGVAAGAAAASVALPGAAEAIESPQEQAKSRYRENDHVKRFYALNRL